MKFLEIPRMMKLSSILEEFDLGDRMLFGRLEAYTMKMAGDDKRLAKEIEQHLQEEQQNHSPSSTQPTVTRKLLVSLITTLNASFPDYDFSDLKPESFEHEPNLTIVMNSLDSMFLNAMEQQQPGIREEFWACLEETIQLNECEIYSYTPEIEDTEDSCLYQTNCFFYNKRKKMMVFFTAHTESKLHQQDLADQLAQEEEDEEEQALHEKLHSEKRHSKDDLIDISQGISNARISTPLMLSSASTLPSSSFTL